MSLTWVDLSEHQGHLGPESREMAVADRNRAIGLREERRGKGHHIVRFAIAQISGIKVAQSHAVEAVGVFQKRCQPPVGMRAH
jgi:hypothetical protein